MELPLPLESSPVALPAGRIPEFASRAVSPEPEQLLELLYDEHSAGIYRWALGMLGSRQEAEDAVQSVWVKLAGRTGRLQEVEAAAAYVWRTARNQVTSRLRRRRLETWWTPRLDEGREDELPAVVGEGVSADERRDLVRGISELRPRFRAVVVLVGLAGFTLEEAAERLEIPRGTAASRYHTAVARLGRLLAPPEDPE